MSTLVSFTQCMYMHRPWSIFKVLFFTLSLSYRALPRTPEPKVSYHLIRLEIAGLSGHNVEGAKCGVIEWA